MSHLRNILIFGFVDGKDYICLMKAKVSANSIPFLIFTKLG